MAMMLGLVTAKPPNLTITPQSADFVIPGSVDVYVVDPKSKRNLLAFSLGIVSNLMHCTLIEFGITIIIMCFPR